MKQALLIGLVATALSPVFAAKKEMPAKEVAPAAPVAAEALSFDAKVNYALGMQLGMQLAGALKDTSMHLNSEAVLAGVKESMVKDQGYLRSFSAGLQSGSQLAGLQKEGIVSAQMVQFEKAFRAGLTGDTAKLGMTETEYAQVMGQLEEKVRTVQMKKIEELKKKNIAEGAAFLAENKSKPGVITTASGLQYKVLNAGTGAKIALGDSLKVHYTGKLLDGKTFDSSVDRGQPFEFVLTDGSLISGWIELLQLMNQGQKVVAWIPEKLAYGDQGSQPVIGPNSTLNFELEILEVKKPVAKPAANKPPMKK